MLHKFSPVVIIYRETAADKNLKALFLSDKLDGMKKPEEEKEYLSNYTLDLDFFDKTLPQVTEEDFEKIHFTYVAFKTSDDTNTSPNIFFYFYKLNQSKFEEVKDTPPAAEGLGLGTSVLNCLIRVKFNQ